MALTAMLIASSQKLVPDDLPLVMQCQAASIATLEQSWYVLDAICFRERQRCHINTMYCIL